MPAMPSHLPPHDCLDPSSQCNQQTPTSEASGQHCSETSFETLSTSGNSGPCCEHHTLPTACGDVKTGSQSQPGPSPYLEEGFSAANPLAGCNLQKNVGIPKVDNSKQCLINNLNRPPGSGGGGEIGNEGNSYANRQVSVLNPQLVNHPALSGLGFDGSLENFDVGNFPLSMVPQYPMNNVTGIDSAILEKLKQLPESKSSTISCFSNSVFLTSLRDHHQVSQRFRCRVDSRIQIVLRFFKINKRVFILSRAAEAD